MFGPRNREEAAEIADCELQRLMEMPLSEIRKIEHRREVIGKDGTSYSVVVERRKEGDDLWRIVVAVDDGGNWLIVPLIRSDFMSE